MNICLIGKNISNLLLAKNLANTGINFDLLYSERNNLSKISTRTIGITEDNIRFIEKNIHGNEIGKLGQNKDNELYVSINKGIIIIDEIQLEGKNRISGSDFVRGYKIFQMLNNEKVFKKLS